MSGGATIMPTAVPRLMTPMAVERSLTGNHSATARVAAGKPPPSPAPSSSRKTASVARFPASAWPADASDQNTMIAVKPARVPSTSANFPPPAYISAYVMRKAVCSSENCWLLTGMSCSMALIATGSVCRSR
jgi:hypothetical protein